MSLHGIPAGLLSGCSDLIQINCSLRLHCFHWLAAVCCWVAVCGSIRCQQDMKWLGEEEPATIYCQNKKQCVKHLLRLCTVAIASAWLRYFELTDLDIQSAPSTEEYGWRLLDAPGLINSCRSNLGIFSTNLPMTSANGQEVEEVEDCTEKLIHLDPFGYLDDHLGKMSTLHNHTIHVTWAKEQKNQGLLGLELRPPTSRSAPTQWAIFGIGSVRDGFISIPRWEGKNDEKSDEWPQILSLFLRKLISSLNIDPVALRWALRACFCSSTNGFARDLCCLVWLGLVFKWDTTWDTGRQWPAKVRGRGMGAFRSLQEALQDMPNFRFVLVIPHLRNVKRLWQL